MKGHGEKLSRKQEQAIVALLQMPTISEAAKHAGIGEATLWRWLQTTEFQEQYRAAKRQAVSQAISRLQQATSKAVNTLESIMGDAASPSSARVAAAKIILEMAVKAVEVEDLSERIEALEKIMEPGRDAG